MTETGKRYISLTTSLLALALIVSAFGEDPPKPLSAQELDWFFTLAVGKNSDHFSFSLMKEGWLAFDSWGDNKEFRELRFEISADQFALLKKKFGDLFEVMQNRKVMNRGDQPAYTFERVADTVTTIEFSGPHPKAIAFLEELSNISKVPLPF